MQFKSLDNLVLLGELRFVKNLEFLMFSKDAVEHS